jgi:NADH-quinone oxidoreductase subunit E
MDGVFIGGCHLNECHYITDGNHHAYAMVQICKKLLTIVGINPGRLRIDQMSAGEGIRFAEIMNDFSKTLRDLGPVSKEGPGPALLQSRLNAVTKLIPYIRLVERERLRVHCNSAEEYEAYFRREEISGLFQELIGDKLAVSQIMTLLREKPRTTKEISEALGLEPSEVSKHLSNSARQGLTRFDESQRRFIPA